MRFHTLVPLVAIACSGKPTTTMTDDATNPGPGKTTETAHSAEPEPPKMITEARFTASIAWDAGTQQVIAPIFDGEEGFISVYSIYLYEEGAYQSGDDEGRCQIVLDLVGMGMSVDALLEGFVWGLDIPYGEKPGFDRDCLEKGFDPSNFVNGDPWASHWMLPDWKLRLGGELASETVDWLSGGFFTTGDGGYFGPEYFAAGDWRSDSGLDGEGFSTDAESNFWYGYTMDVSGEVGDERLSLEDMTFGGQLATGWYVFDQSVFFGIEPPAATTPK